MLSSTYDDRGNILTRADSGGFSQTKTYDDRGNQVTLVQSSRSHQREVLTPTTFYENGQLASYGDLVIPQF